MTRLDFSNESGVRIQRKIFEDVFDVFTKMFKNKGGITLVLVDDKAIKKINSKWRKKNKTTDVISFAYLEGKKMPLLGVIGDIFISMDTANRQAKEHKHSLEKELQILFTHGLLHVFGFDHQNDSQEKEMEKWAKKILKQVHA